jgi:hypothetical protein
MPVLAAKSGLIDTTTVLHRAGSTKESGVEELQSTRREEDLRSKS